MNTDDIPKSLRLPSLAELEQLERDCELAQLLLPLVANETREQRIRRIIEQAQGRLTTADRLRPHN